jgi:hypothetical protein
VLAGLTKSGAAGFVFACLATLMWFVTDELQFYPGRTLVVVSSFAWPFLLLICSFFATRAREVVLALGIYVAVFLAVGFFLATNWYDPLVLWGTLNGPATALTLGFFWYRVRAVGPLALAFVLFVFLGASLGMAWLSRNVGSASNAGSMLGAASAEIVVLVVLLAGALPAMGLGFALLTLLGRLYRNKQLSEQELLADAIVFTFTLFLCLDLAFAGKTQGYFALGFLAFAGYYLTSRLLRPRSDRSASRVPRLLLLRVFGEPAAASKLWRALGKSWRHVGTVFMIGGADLAITALEPHRFLDFIGRRLKDRFLRSPESLEHALETLDETADADGRYPVNELYCWNDTWRAAFRACTDRCDVILLDLRGFNQQRQGAAFELGELASRGLLSRVVLLTDGSTNEALIADIVGRSPHNLPPRKFVIAGRRIPTLTLTQTLFDVARTA